ncbi:MAG: hypothetical protein WBL25_09805, partial [Anaerolineales bacterium]
MDEKTIPLKQVLNKLKKPVIRLNQNWNNNLPYHALFEQTGVCIFIISLDFHYITANQQALNLL